MQDIFFKQFKGGVWSPPITPELDSPQWAEHFDAGNSQEKTNIINGWLSHLNSEIATKRNPQEKAATLAWTIEQNHKWLRQSLPYCTNKMFISKTFDGSAVYLLNATSTLNKLQKEHFAKPLTDLWLSNDNDIRLAAATELVKLVDWLSHSNNSNLRPPALGHLITNLVWDLVEENPNNIQLHIDAAYLSILSSETVAHAPSSRYGESVAWNALVRVGGYKHATAINKLNKEKIQNILNVIQSSDPLVAAANLPLLMQAVRNDTGKSSPYLNDLGVASVATKVTGKDVSKLTDYDILRVFIPSKSSFWDTAEALDVPYEETCNQLVQEALKANGGPLALPNNLELSV